MKNIQLVSVIIPVYNSEKTISRCIESVINQTYDSFEIILIDDGSTDNSKYIIQSFIIQNPNKIRYIYQSNSGVSTARNKGLNICKGEYIVFLDSDDYLDKNFIGLLWSNIKNFDLVQINFTPFVAPPLPESLKNYQIEQLSNSQFIDKSFNNYHFYAVWGKLIKKSVLNSLLFDSKLFFSEDLNFIFNLLSNNSLNILYISNYYGYYYSKESVSLVRSSYNINKFNRISELLSWKNTIKQKFNYKKYNTFLVRELLVEYSEICIWNSKEADYLLSSISAKLWKNFSIFTIFSYSFKDFIKIIIVLLNSRLVYLYFSRKK